MPESGARRYAGSVFARSSNRFATIREERERASRRLVPMKALFFGVE